jgi:photosystem II stability/assembly factor-like uncharacterized protein
MKIYLIQVFCFGIALNCMCQNPDSAVIDINGMKIMIDGIPVNGKTINLAPGKHNAEIGNIEIKTLSFLKGIYYSYGYEDCKLNFTVEKGKLYTVTFPLTNFYDTTTRTIYFNHFLPQLTDEKTSKGISRIESLIKFDPITDSCGILHLNYKYDILDTGQLALIHIPSLYSLLSESIFLIGRTTDNYNISYVNYDISQHYNNDKSPFKKLIPLKCKDLKIYLKPGYYWLGYNYYGPSITNPNPLALAITYNSFNFLAEPGDTTIIDPSSNRPNKFDKTFKAFPGTNLNSIFFLPDNKYGWIVGDNGIIISTKNGGETWYFSQNGKRYNRFSVERTKTYNNYTDVCFIDSLTGWIMGDLGCIIHTKDGGVTWTTQKTNSSFALRGNVRFFNERFGFAANSYISYKGANFFSTLNGGETWKLLVNENKYAMFYAFSFDNIWKVTNSEILHSTNMCQTWTSSLVRKKDSATDNYTTKRENFIYFIDPMNGWILQDGIQGTKDGGKTWQKQKINITPDLVFFINKDCGWAFAPHGIIFKTLDGGENWLMLNTKNVVNDISRVYFTDQNSGWAVGLNGFIYNTTDGGQNWNVLNVLDLI